MYKPLIIANWKMNPAVAQEASELALQTEKAAAANPGVETVIAPPFPFLHVVHSSINTVKLGAQNAFWEDVGPFTGEVSWRQLNDTGVSHVIVGHSERRMYLHESDEMVHKKLRAVLGNGMYAVLCIGERQREGNEIPAEAGEQLRGGLQGIKKSLLAKLVVAYEPVWAISTNSGARPDTPENAFQAMMYIRKILTTMHDRKTADSVRIIYGGSVNAKNISLFLKDGGMQGALVGSASLQPKEFQEIIRLAGQVRL